MSRARETAVITLLFCLSRRRSNRASRPAFVLREHAESGPSGGGGGGSSEQCEQPAGDWEQARGGISMPNSLLGYQSRSPLFRTLSRSSSGYFSFDSEPGSPLVTHSASTQTPSPSGQVIIHALQRISEARGDGQSYDLWPHDHYPPHGAASAGDMRAESYVAQELRRIGDEFNQLYFQGVSLLHACPADARALGVADL
ncbi:hypothetical protein NFI96_019584 [Prochilodus magdalenae]|nr:hypothetical protein NFI96_019584 [Prochilodus magdalenae]